MHKTILTAALLCATAACLAAEPAIDNDRVTVRTVEGRGSAAEHDFVAVSLSEKGAAAFGHRGDIPGKADSRTVVIELKDYSVAPLANASGYPLAFSPSAGKEVVRERTRGGVELSVEPGEPTAMHFHDKDAVVVFEDDGALKSTTPDGTSVTTASKPGDLRFSPKARNSYRGIVERSPERRHHRVEVNRFPRASRSNMLIAQPPAERCSHARDERSHQHRQGRIKGRLRRHLSGRVGLPP